MRVETFGSCALYLGDAREIVHGVRGAHASVTDPPYHLQSIQKRFAAKGRDETGERYAAGPYGRHAVGFMGQKWDGGDISFRPETWDLVMAALRPGAHLAAFTGTRTYHRIACAIEDAGFEIRDMLAWVYGSGFPKSHNLKDEKWAGWGTALKPALEPIVFGRKSLVGTVAETVLEHETGAINIDACRIEGRERVDYGLSGDEGPVSDVVYGARQRVDAGQRRRAGEPSADKRYTENGSTNFAMIPGPRGGDVLGRWPANVVTDGSVDVYASFPREAREAMRFFYAAKASKAEREMGLEADDGKRANVHPTVKPVALMQWLCRLVTPSGGLVLDPFMGSGSTGIACVNEGFRFIGIEQDEKYFDIACRRIEAAVREFDGTIMGAVQRAEMS